MASFDLNDRQWAQIADLFESPCRPGRPARIPRRQMVEAMLFICRTGIQWRYLPERYGRWGAVWQQWRRWRSNGVWSAAMSRLRMAIRYQNKRDTHPSLVMIDAQTVKGGRAGPTFHARGGRGGRVIGAKRTIMIDILGLLVACRVDSAQPHDVISGRALLREQWPSLPRMTTIMGDRGYRGLAEMTTGHKVTLSIKSPPSGSTGFVPLTPLYRVEQAFARLGRWRRLSRCFEGTTASARAWLEVASVGEMIGQV